MTLVLPLGAGPTPAAKRKDRALRVGQMACALLPHSAQSPLCQGHETEPNLDSMSRLAASAYLKSRRLASSRNLIRDNLG